MLLFREVVMSIKARFWQSIVPTVCLSLMLTTAASAREAVVKLDDGREIRGELVTENAQEVVLEIAGIRTTFARQRVSSVEYVKSIKEQYQERRTQIADDDLDKRYDLARWLFENKSYDLAKSELADLIKRYPNDGRLVPLQNLIDAQIRIQNEQGSAPAQPRPQQPQVKQPATPKPSEQPDTGEAIDYDRQAPHPRMTEEQINLLRVYEVDPGKQPNVHVPNEVMEEVYRRYAGEEGVPVGASAQRQALGWPGWRKLDLLFKLRARELYPQVIVHTEPQTIQNFRTTVHSRYLLPYCATTACHGGKDAGSFFVFRFEPASNATVYSNYLILNKTNNSRGYMIDHERPDRSLLVQYGLPRADAAIPHPDVPGWRPLFRNAQDPRAVGVSQWVRSLGVTPPDYPINYQLPGKAAATTQPATAPAAP